jgi:hypothetical protein
MWLLLIHQLPPKPEYLRAKIGRRLQRIGALTIKNTVYLLPHTEQTLEDFEWTAREIRAGGGEANIFEARFVDGLADGDVQKRFNDARDAGYAPLIAEARAIRKRKKKDPEALAALRDRSAEIARIDFFGAPNGQALAALLDEGPADTREVPRHLRNKTWVTRAGVHVDRIASAWLIRRFIDDKAKFRFVTGKTHAPAKNEIRFDMFEAEFTHEGNRCTFEVLMNRVRPSDRALRAIADIVHDIDLKEERFRHVEGRGVAALIDGITLAHREDVRRIDRASDALDDLYAYFQRK